ncbi:T cell receptor alpha chain MC.7.G5-like isoform X2 [Dermochelys coriacea]|uniref:T cell receptor alpha chain MC.7.G5-like isoform X2 n=1 Tax=Dermochelys coriacea TaxID=27794 RepID=UPI001CA9BBBC|nr:T cell receptor alpha chain MC.7.G5-like isoform X2 [Dermochelys coriacea]
MRCLLVQLYVLLLLSGLSTEKNSVTQRQGELTGVQNESVTLDCTFSTEDAGYDIYWYIQESSGQTKYLFRRSARSEHNGAGSRFSLDFRPAEKYVGAPLNSMGQTPGFSQGQGSVTQTQGQMEKLGGQTITLECTFSTAYQNYYLFWYRQQRSGRMDFLFRIDYNNAEKNGAGRRFSAQFRKSSKFFSLTIIELKPTDSAMYFCALWEDTVSRLIGSPVQKPIPLAFSA